MNTSAASKQKAIRRPLSIISSCTTPPPGAGGEAITYYRLKINDFDGKADYSKTISIRQKGQPRIKIYPNPTKENVTIDLGETDNVTIRLVDILPYFWAGFVGIGDL